jgi:hypothetical protein
MSIYALGSDEFALACEVGIGLTPGANGTGFNRPVTQARTGSKRNHNAGSGNMFLLGIFTFTSTARRDSGFARSLIRSPVVQFVICLLFESVAVCAISRLSALAMLLRYGEGYEVNERRKNCGGKVSQVDKL